VPKERVQSFDPELQSVQSPFSLGVHPKPEWHELEVQVIPYGRGSILIPKLPLSSEILNKVVETKLLLKNVLR